MSVQPAAAPKLAPVAAAPVAPKIEPSLLAKAAKAPVDAMIFFNDPVSAKGQSAMQALTAVENLPLGTQRKQAAVGAMRELTAASLAENMPALEQLKTAGKLSGIDQLWALNAVRIRGASIDTLKSIVGPNIKTIVSDEIPVYPTMSGLGSDVVDGAAMMFQPTTMVPQGKAEPSPKGFKEAQKNSDTVWIDWGTKKMGAPAAWAQGITGAGITIGVLDTGVITDHPGLKRNYRGTKADGTQDHNYNLFNGVEKGAKYPIDDVGHGTHVTGSAVGYHPNHLVGVAPGAKYVVGRGLGEAGGSLFALMAGMEWMMAPTDLEGKNPRPDLAPDIVTNSWGGGPQSIPFFAMELRNWRRAGIVPVFAAGNARRPNPNEVSSPGLYDETVTVGATDKKDGRAYFSMYGPSPFSKQNKPEIAAPGEMIYSAYPDGTFRDTFIIDGKPYPASGTSMATPHVAGAIALYMQANPDAKYDQILDALKRASTLYATPSTELGWGRLAVDKLITPQSIAKNAKLEDPEFVKELVAQAAKAKIFGEKELVEGYVPPKRIKDPSKRAEARRAS